MENMERLKKKYIIYAPKYSKSNGVRVLYKLRQLLEKRGYEAYIFAPFSDEALNTKYIKNITSEMKKNDIVIYPEVTTGNPLEFQNVVRYILYYPGKNGGESVYDEYEKEFTFFDFYKKDTEILYINNIDRNLFFYDGTQKDIDSYFVYKGGKWKDLSELKDAVEINSEYPQKRLDLANLLRRTKTLYSYDRHTILLDEALLCGCTVKIITEDGFEDYKISDSSLNEPEEIGLDNFIKITQMMNYTGKIRKENKLRQFKAVLKLIKYSTKYIIYNFLLINKQKASIYREKIDSAIFKIRYKGW